MRLDHAGQVISDLFGEVRRRQRSTGICQKCQQRMLLRQVNELMDSLGVPSVFRGHTENSAGYHLSRIRR